MELQKEFHEFLIEQFSVYSKELSSWHNQICHDYSDSVPHWWYTQGSRLIAWQPPIYQALFFALALAKFRQQKKISSVNLNNAPEELAEYLKEFDPEGNYIISFEREIQISWIKKLRNKIGPYWEVVRLFRDALFHSKPLSLKASYDLGIYSHFWGLKHFKQSGDHFYGNMLEVIPGNKKALWIYYPAQMVSDNDKKEIILLNEGKCDVIFVEDHWRLSDAFLILFKLGFHTFKVKFFLRPIATLSIDNFQCKKFPQRFRKKLIQDFLPLDELKIEVFFKKLHERISLSKIIYPFEDKGLERAILKVSSTRAKTYGYAHAIHNPGHLYLDKKVDSPGYPPRPNYIICTGSLAAKAIEVRSNLAAEKILIGGSNRYKERSEEKIRPINNKVRILLLSGQSHEIGIFANWVEENPEGFRNIELVVRKYPFAYQREQDLGITRLKKHMQVIEENLNLERQVLNSEIVIFASTSAGYEGMLAGRIGIYAHLHHIVPLNSLDGKGDSNAIFKAMNSKDLIDHIRYIQNLSFDRLEILINKQRQFVQDIYSKPNLSFLWSDN